MRLRDLSIKWKLVTTIMAVSVTAILISGLILFGYEHDAMEELMERDLGSLARAAAMNTTAALTFDDARAAEDTLSSFSEKPSVEAAALYGRDGRLFASYVRRGVAEGAPGKPREDGIAKGGHLEYYGPVLLKGERIGTIYVRSDYSQLRDWTAAYAWTFAGVVALMALLALVLSSLLQKPFSAPLVELAEIARQVSEKKDYSLRARKHGGDETGLLVEKFNEMLAQIQARDEALEEARNQLEQRVKERTRDLEEANKELESFSYSVAHDLRAPLRSIHGFSQVLLEDYAGSLDDAGKGYLDRVCGATRRMGHLLDDMLNLSRVTRSALRPTQVDMRPVAAEIFGDLQQQQPGRKVEVVMAAPLPAFGDPGLIRIVLDNLLGNAWKFTGKRGDARIEFGQAQIDGDQAFFVRDNGAGFDMAHATKLFSVFHRLHRESEFPGTGVGLATVQRIVLRHGGKIWAESAVGKGATFYFTFARQENPS